MKVLGQRAVTISPFDCAHYDILKLLRNRGRSFPNFISAGALHFSLWSKLTLGLAINLQWGKG